VRLDDLLPAYKRIGSETQRSPNINEITSLTENRMKISNYKMSVQSGDYDDENLLNKVNSRDLVPIDNNNDVEAKINQIQSMAQELDREQFRLGDNYSKSITNDPFVSNANNPEMPSTFHQDSSHNANQNTQEDYETFVTDINNPRGLSPSKMEKRSLSPITKNPEKVTNFHMKVTNKLVN